MRVIAGSAKGVRLARVPAGVRPVSDRAREGLFSSLGDVSGARILDLYAGTGALGIEALSRGAGHAVFVDRLPSSIRAIHENLRRTDLEHAAEVVRSQAERFVTRHDKNGAPFDLVLADPPYDESEPAVSTVLSGLDEGFLAPASTVVLTRRKGSSTDVIPVHFLPARRLDYGDTILLICRRPALK